MKLLSQIIALLLVGANSLQIILTIGTAVVMLKLLFDKVYTARSRWIIRKRRKVLENDMWAIE
jgi:hypothetical protein